jgi:hypothetical protein
MTFLSAGLEAQDLYEEEVPLTESEIVAEQLKETTRVLDEVSEVFQRFSDGYMEANEALKRVDLLSHSYEKALKTVLPEGEALHGMMKAMFSQVEQYLVHFKNTDREDPVINIKIINIKREINQEMFRLGNMYL